MHTIAFRSHYPDDMCTFEICVDQVNSIKAKCFGMRDKTLPRKDKFMSIFSISSTYKKRMLILAYLHQEWIDPLFACTYDVIISYGNYVHDMNC